MRERRGSIPEERKSQDSSGVSSTDCADHAVSQRCQFGKFSWPTLRHGFLVPGHSASKLRKKYL